MRLYTVERDKEGMPPIVVTAEIAFHTSRDGLAGKLLQEGITADELRRIDGGPEALERWKAGDDTAVNDFTIRSGADASTEVGEFSTASIQLGFEWPPPNEESAIDDDLSDISHLDFGLTDLELLVDVASERPGTNRGFQDSGGRTDTAVATIDVPGLTAREPFSADRTDDDEREFARSQVMRELWANESQGIEANDWKEATEATARRPRRKGIRFWRRRSKELRTANSA
jgi:hypothetical protein